MFHCEKCGSRYNAAYAVAIESCPRCQARDGTESPLTFSPFRRFELRPPKRMPTAAMQSRQASESVPGGMIAAS